MFYVIGIFATKQIFLFFILAQKLILFSFLNQTQLDDNDKKRHYFRCIAMHNSLRLAKALKTLPEQALEYNSETENLSLEAAENLQSLGEKRISKACSKIDSACFSLLSLPMLDFIMFHVSFLQFFTALFTTISIITFCKKRKPELWEACVQQSKLAFYYT